MVEDAQNGSDISILPNVKMTHFVSCTTFKY